MHNEWDATFESLLRRHLRFLPAEATLEPADDLRALGLDSMATIELMLNLEDKYGVAFPDDALAAAAWSTPAALWNTVLTLPRETI
jgi:acyl carrier protein